MAWENYVKDQTKANRGRDFEEFINFANSKYQTQGVAVMHKVPTEFLPLRNSRGQVTSCKVTHKSCVDYLGHFQGIPVAVEAKSTQAARMDFSAVQDHQAAFLDDWMDAGGKMAFVTICYGMKRYFSVPWPFWKAARDAWEQHKRTGEKVKKVVQAYGWAWETPGTASISADGLHPDWEIVPGGIYGLPYLQIIQKIAGGNSNDYRGPGDRVF